MNENHQSECGDLGASTPAYARRFAGAVGQYFLAIQNRKILRGVADVSGGRLLDVGGGHAQVTPLLASRNYLLTVAASSPECEALLLQEMPDGGYEFVVCDLLNLPFPNEHFDGVVCLRLLAHETAWEQQLAELCRVARQTVVIDYPDRRSFNALTSLLFGIKKLIEKDTRPYRLYTRRMIISQFKKNGFAKVSMRPEFFFPMALHRWHGSGRLVRWVEDSLRAMKTTKGLGSPVIARFDRMKRPG